MDAEPLPWPFPRLLYVVFYRLAVSSADPDYLALVQQTHMMLEHMYLIAQ